MAEEDGAAAPGVRFGDGGEPGKLKAEARARSTRSMSLTTMCRAREGSLVDCAVKGEALADFIAGFPSVLHGLAREAAEARARSEWRRMGAR